MTPLGRGLASLIPHRHQRDADEIIEEIDSEEETVEEQTDEARKMQVLEELDEQISDEVQDDTNEDEVEEVVENEQPTEKQVTRLSVVEELEEMDDEPMPMPEKPKVTPLTIDPETGRIVREEVVVANEDEQIGDEEVVADEDEATIETQEDIDDGDEDVPETEEKTAVVEEPEEDEPIVEELFEEKKQTPVMDKKIAKTVKKSTTKENKKSSVLSKARNENDEVPTLEPLMERRLLGEKVAYLALGDIGVNPEQPRRSFEEQELLELMQSLEQHGMLQPMVVMKHDGEPGYQIIAGERRFRAAKQLGWKEVPCVVRGGVSGSKNRLELALTENVQRENLNPIEEALGYKRLNAEYGMSHEEIGERVGKSRVAITNAIRVLQLPTEIQRGISEGKISMGHARAILMVPDEGKQLRFYQHVVDEGLTVRKTEIRARNIQRSMNISDPMRRRVQPDRSMFAQKYDGQLQNRYGFNARVKFNVQRNRFEVVFYAHSESECKDLVEMLLGEKIVPENVDSDVMEDRA